MSTEGSDDPLGVEIWSQICVALRSLNVRLNVPEEEESFLQEKLNARMKIKMTTEAGIE